MDTQIYSHLTLDFSTHKELSDIYTVISADTLLESKIYSEHIQSHLDKELESNE